MTADRSPYSQRCSIISDPRSAVKFLITDCPDPNTLKDEYATLLQGNDCSTVIRLCDPSSYNAEILKEEGITVCDWPFEDGSVPPDTIIEKWRQTLDSLQASNPHPAIAIHCVSGIGRAPILVTCALIDCGIDPIEAVEIVRKQRRGALNKKQLAWLMDKKKGFKKKKDGGGKMGKLFGGMFGKKS
ncbi:protein-tyrosine phosphatase-like protein [Phlyctochytrium arcticum]|nr:protein-tyrosine phosphatase-like protein [Phlyctochytrium arcticum]